jgi:hypothetical protein
LIEVEKAAIAMVEEQLPVASARKAQQHTTGLRLAANNVHRHSDFAPLDGTVGKSHLRCQ